MIALHNPVSTTNPGCMLRTLRHTAHAASVCPTLPYPTIKDPHTSPSNQGGVPCEALDVVSVISVIVISVVVVAVVVAVAVDDDDGGVLLFPLLLALLFCVLLCTRLSPGAHVVSGIVW